MMTCPSNALRWYVLRTNPQCEDRAKASLEAAGFVSYLPKMRKETRHVRTKQWLVKEYPLFTGYIFVGLKEGEEHWGYVRSCDGVERPLGVNGKPLCVPSHEVEGFIEAQGNGEFDQMHRSSLKRPFRVEDPVQIKTGPFAGYSGNVTSIGGKRQIEIMVRIFGRLTPVNIDERQVKAA